jgi:8-oxo-dGTP pyrophosphatase MutT (NUDIX family)
LLFRFRDADGGSTWLTPGGGLHRGETVRAAAVRELAEETGYVASEEDLGPVVATRAGLWRSNRGRPVFGADTYFLVRVTHPDISTAGHEELERSIITGHRWWTAAELRETSEAISPPNAAALVATLISDGPPPHPVRLPWRSALLMWSRGDHRGEPARYRLASVRLLTRLGSPAGAPSSMSFSSAAVSRCASIMSASTS